MWNSIEIVVKCYVVSLCEIQAKKQKDGTNQGYQEEDDVYVNEAEEGGSERENRVCHQNQILATFIR